MWLCKSSWSFLSWSKMCKFLNYCRIEKVNSNTQLKKRARRKLLLVLKLLLEEERISNHNRNMHNGKNKTTYRGSRKDSQILLKSKWSSKILQPSTRLTSPLSLRVNQICMWLKRIETFTAVKLYSMTLTSMPTSTVLCTDSLSSSRHNPNQDKWSTQAAQLPATLLAQNLTDLFKSTKLMQYVLSSSRLISRLTEDLSRRI